ncbi:MAG: hypothetical protein F4X97_05385 [Boseongicola sp. SB0662_bin_57]|nr:hypothetical protein [Boseongicola sp. SB0662_bin_57]
MLAAEAVTPLRVGKTQVVPGIFATIFDDSSRQVLSLVPAASRIEPGETSGRIMAVQVSRNIVHFLVHPDTCKIGIAESCCRRTGKLAVARAPGSDHAIEAAS